MASIFSLYGNIFVDNEKANKSIEDTTKKGKESSKSFGESFADVSKKAMQIGTAVVGATTAIVGGLTAAANSTAKVADEIDKGSIRMGISNKYYQELGYAAGQCGVEMTSLEKAAKKLEGTDLNMEDAMNQIMALGTAEERATKAAELFGENIAYTLSPLIEQSTDDYDGLIQRANDLGLIMGDDAVSAGVKFGDTMSDVQQSLGAVGNKLMSSLIPILQKVLDLIIDHMPQIQAMIDKLAPILISLLENILPIFVEFAEQLLPIIFDILEQLLPVLSGIIEGILPIFTDILKIILPPLVQIIQQLLPVLLPILESLLTILQPIFDLLLWVVDNILKPIISVITSIANVISKLLVGALKGLTPVVNGVKDIFEKVFGAIFNIVKAPINFVIDGINLFIKALNKIKIPDWVPGVGGKGINIPLIKKLRVGMEYVPYDEMPAILHKGERVLTADENKELRQERLNAYNSIEIDYDKIEDRMYSAFSRAFDEFGGVVQLDDEKVGNYIVKKVEEEVF